MARVVVVVHADISKLSLEMGGISINHIPRSANKVDDGLTKNGRRAVVAEMPG